MENRPRRRIETVELLDRRMRPARLTFLQPLPSLFVPSSDNRRVFEFGVDRRRSMGPFPAIAVAPAIGASVLCWPAVTGVMAMLFDVTIEVSRFW